MCGGLGVKSPPDEAGFEFPPKQSRKGWGSRVRPRVGVIRTPDPHPQKLPEFQQCEDFGASFLPGYIRRILTKAIATGYPVGMAISFEEAFTAPTLIKWRPSDLRELTAFCTDVGIDRASFVRGVAMAVLRRPEQAMTLLDLPEHVCDRIVQRTLPLEFREGPAAEKPAKAGRSAPKGGRRGGRG